MPSLRNEKWETVCRNYVSGRSVFFACAPEDDRTHISRANERKPATYSGWFPHNISPKIRLITLYKTITNAIKRTFTVKNSQEYAGTTNTGVRRPGGKVSQSIAAATNISMDLVRSGYSIRKNSLMAIITPICNPGRISSQWSGNGYQFIHHQK